MVSSLLAFFARPLLPSRGGRSGRHGIDERRLAMAYFMTNATMAWGAHAKCAFLDADGDKPFDNLPYAKPDEVKLTAPETEHKYTIGHGYRVIADRAPKKALWQARKAEYAITDLASIFGQTIVS